MNAFHKEIADALRPVIRDVIREELERQKQPQSQFVTVAEAAEIARVSERTVRRWISEGMIASVRRGARLLIPREEVG